MAARRCASRSVQDKISLHSKSFGCVFATQLVLCGSEDPDPEILESLGLLGKDSSDASNEILIAIGENRPGFLAPVVESIDVAQVMSKHDPKLLAWLAEQYYIEKPRTETWGGSWHDRGNSRS